jgi:hypothetical protein
VNGWRKVTEAEFDAFLAAYPEPLHCDVSGICDPPVASWNDFADGKTWPESMVAKRILNTAMRGHPAYFGEPDDYFVRGKP